MRKKYLTAHGGIAALLAALLSVCLAFGLWLFNSANAYAEETTSSEPTAEETEGETGDAEEKNENYWEVTPNLVSWKWGEFDPAINKISGKAAYGNNSLQFLIWHVISNEDGEVIIYDNYEGIVPNGSSSGEKSKALFCLDEKGEMPEVVIEKLKTLDYGTYALVPSVAETEEATGLGSGVDPNNSFMFNVLKGENRWVTSPYITPWKWGEFRNNTNLLTAVPAYGARVRFSVYKGVTYADAKLQEFYTVSNTMSNGAVTGDAEAALKSLDAGNYYLRAYVEGTDNYDVLDTRVQFTVQQVQNSWTATPNVVQWNWSEYNPELNVISAVPAYPAKDAEVVYGVYTDKECRNAVDEKLENFTSLTEERQNILKNLDAGTYYLEAETRYLSNNFTDISSVVPFTVHTVQNIWTTTPSIVQWKYGEYDSSINTITAVPKFANGAVTYGIYTDEAHNSAVEGLGGFTEVTKEIAEKLGNLGAGAYYLYASSAQASNSSATPNFSGIETQTAIPFSILQLQNYWTVTPSVLAWKYGEYSRTFNLITAAAATGAPAQFSVYDEDGIALGFVNSENTTVTAFELVTENGTALVPEYVATRLKALNAGTYYMLASVEGGESYTGLNNYTSIEDVKEHGIKFEISAVTNVWTSIPAVLSWNEGHFSDKNKISAEAAYGNDKMVIIVYDSDNRVITSNQNNAQLDYGAIGALSVGLYTVSFSIAETENYSELTGKIEFSVMEDSVALGGIIAATIAFAVLDIVAAGTCITLLIIRRRKIEQQFRKMISKELHGGKI